MCFRAKKEHIVKMSIFDSKTHYQNANIYEMCIYGKCACFIQSNEFIDSFELDQLAFLMK